MTEVPGHAGRVFVDTSAYFAAANRRDAGHEPVATLMQGLVDARRRLVTTNFAQFGWAVLDPTARESPSHP